MMWQELLKADVGSLPSPNALIGMLTSDESVPLIESKAKGDNKKNIIRIRNKANVLSTGKGIPPEFEQMQDKIVSNAKKISSILSELITEENIKGQKGSHEQRKLETKFDAILSQLQEGNKEPLITFVGKGINSWSSKTRKRKKDFLLNNKKTIIDLLGHDDTELFYYSTNRVYSTTQMDALDEINTSLGDYGIKVVTGKDRIDIQLPKKINVKQYEDLKNSIYTFEQRKDNPIKFTRNGKVIKSPLLEVLGTIEPSQELEERVESAEGKNYVNNVASAENALDYFKLMTSTGWRKKVEFMPTPKLKNKKALVNARNQILLAKGKNPTVSVTLKTVLTSSKLNLDQMLESGEQLKTKKFVPQKILALLEKDYDKQSELYSKDRPDLRGSYAKPIEEEHESGVSLEDIKELREVFLNRNEEFNRFYKYVHSKKGTKHKESYDKLEEYYGEVGTNLFTESEVEFINGLSNIEDLDVLDIQQELQEHYNIKDVDMNLALSLEKILENKEEKDLSLFRNVRGDSYKFTSLGIPIEAAKNFVAEMKKIRGKGDTVEVEISSGNSFDELSDAFKPRFVEDPNNVTGANLLHMLIVLDFYYGNKTLTRMKNAYHDDPSKEALKEIVKKADTEYSSIIGGVVESVKDKVDDMLKNKTQYMELLSYAVKNSKDRMYKLFGRMAEKNLIKEE